MDLLGIFLLALSIVVAVVCITLEARDERQLPAEPESEEMERVSAWDWPAKATGPVAEAHFGKVRLAHERPERRAA